MKIAVLASTVYPIRKPFYGGMEMHTYELVKQLQNRGHDVTLFAAKGSDPSLNVVEVAKPTFNRNSANWYQLNKRVKNYLYDKSLQLKFAELVNDIASQGFDVIHNNSLYTLPIRYANLIKIPILTTLHVPPIKYMRRGIAKSIDMPLHKIVSVSHRNASLWADAIGLNADVVYNGVDIDKWNFKTEMPDHKFAIWVGRITPEKGLEYAIKASMKAGIDLKIVGPVYDEAYFDKVIQPLLGDKVRYYGHLDHEIINHITLTASVAIVSSIWDEPFGLVTAEALASGTPVAGFRIGAIPEIVTPMTGELATVKNVDELASAIQLCLTKDPVKCRESVQRRFTMNTMIDNYEASYEALLMKKYTSTKLLTAYDNA